MIILLSLNGCIYANMTFPLSWISNTRLDVKDLSLEEQEISGQSTARVILGLVGWGDAGLDAALENAKKNAGFEVKNVYDVKTDIKKFNILFLYTSQTTILKAKVAK